VNGRSILLELKATKFPRSFPLDIMHLLFEGVSFWIFKAEEWTNWTCLYSLPLLVNYLKNPRDYAKKDISRLPAFKMVFHYLLHVQESIRDCGPCWTFWQYPIERLCGMLQPM
ncbi:21603_t:CDS:2, partial [Gigaspora margarita]